MVGADDLRSTAVDICAPSAPGGVGDDDVAVVGHSHVETVGIDDDRSRSVGDVARSAGEIEPGHFAEVGGGGHILDFVGHAEADSARHERARENVLVFDEA